MSKDPDRIWLQNARDAKLQDEGRMWCEDKVWPEEDGDGEPTEYVRADLYSTAHAEIERLARELEAARENDFEAQQLRWKQHLNDHAAYSKHVDELEAEIEKLREALVVTNAQLAEMEFLSIEGFMGWKEDRAARALSAGEPE